MAKYLTTRLLAVYYDIHIKSYYHSPTRLSMIKLMQGSEEINSNGGFSLVKKQLDGNIRMKDWDAELPAAPNSLYPTSAIVRSGIGLMAAGDSGYADIEKFRSDFLFRRLVGGDVPSQETFRQRLDALAE